VIHYYFVFILLAMGDPGSRAGRSAQGRPGDDIIIICFLIQIKENDFNLLVKIKIIIKGKTSPDWPSGNACAVIRGPA
jgi:hypothetical protein